MKVRIAYLSLVLAIAVAACSSTAKQSKKDIDDLLPTETPTIIDTGTGAPSVSPTSTASPAAPIVGGGKAGRPAGPKPVAPSAIEMYGPPSTHGITSKTIKIGFWFINTDVGCQVTGIEQTGGRCVNDDVTQINALTSYINSHGGIAGRTLVSKIYETKVSDGQYQAQAQSVCDAMVNDDDVFAGQSEGQVGRPFMTTCLRNAGRMVIDPGTWPYDTVLAKQYRPYLFQPSRSAPERWVRAYIDGLAAQGFFKPGIKLGLVRWEAEPFDRVTDKVLMPRLAAHGVNVANVVEAELTPAPSLSGYGTTGNQINNTILRFQNEDVTHVIFFGTMGEIGTFWYAQAHAAGFYPRYGLGSHDYFRSLSEEDAANFTGGGGAIGVAWLPYFDVTPQNAIAPTASTKTCDDIMKKAGIGAEAAGRKTHCDGIFFFKAVLDRAPVLNIKAIRATVDGLRNSFIPASVFANYFSPGRHDGVSVMRYIKHYADCNCFKYYGPARAMP